MIRWNYITKNNPQNSGPFIRSCLFWFCLTGQQLTQFLCHEWWNVRYTDLNVLPVQQELETECTDFKITFSEPLSFSNEQPYWSREEMWMDNNTALKETWREQPVKMYSASWHQSYERHAETVENKHGVSRENCSCVRVLSLSYDVFLLLHFKEPRWQLVAFFGSFPFLMTDISFRAEIFKLTWEIVF